jgi:hypothetical protein
MIPMFAHLKAALPLVLVFIGAALQAVEAERASDGHSAGLSVSSTGHFKRTSAVLATDGGISAHSTATASSSTAAASTFKRLHEAVMTNSRMIPGVGRDAMKCLMGCVCLLVLYKLIISIDCNSKKLDCRRFKIIARFLMYIGYDEYQTFRVTVTVHSLDGQKPQGWTGADRKFKVKVAFKWSFMMTAATDTMKWEQTKGLDVPQGTEECYVYLIEEGAIKKNCVMGEYVLDLKRDMIDAKKFWGERKRLKLEKNGTPMGAIAISFRNFDDPDGGGGGMGELPIDGIDEDGGLALAIREAYEEMQKEDKIPKPEPKPTAAGAEGEDGAPPAAVESEVVKLEGHLKIDCLGRCCTGPLRWLDKADKDLGKVFVRIIHCNVAELSGDDMKKEMAAQWKKANEKGLTELQKKWYFVMYHDKKDAYHFKNWHDPIEFFPMTAISKISRDPKKNDAFVVTHQDPDAADDKSIKKFKREGGRSLDVWYDGLDHCFREVREVVKAEKEKEKGR